MKNIYISTDNLILREISGADVLAIERIRRAINSTPTNRPYYDLKEPEDTVRFWKTAMAEQEVTPRRTISLAVTEKETPHKMIGFVIGELLPQSPENWLGKVALIDLGYFIDPAYQGKGYATEASRGFLSKIFFERVGFDHCSATVHPENEPSKRVLHHLGMKVYGETIKVMNGKREPRLLLEISKKDFYSHINQRGEKKNLDTARTTHPIKGFLQYRER